ncbi:MAG: FAD/NAD(P)-binding protein [Allosphingosinicella sp.]
MTSRHVAVIGAGASGTLAALHLLRERVDRVTLVERERVPGRGTAYGTRRAEHLLNVTAHRMSVWPDDPEHFARWYADRGGAADDFAPRRLFGDYLAGLLAAAGDRVRIVTGEAIAVDRRDGTEHVALADGRTIAADAVVLAPGNYRPAPLPGFDPARLGALYAEDPWYGGFTDGLTDRDTVLLIGTALTSIDAALTLDAAGFRGDIVAISRRGLVPRAHFPREPVAEPPGELPGTFVGLLRHVRARARVIGWREAVHELRNVTQQIWGAAPLDQRRRFVRHLRPWWDVHRHRIAPAVAERIAEMERGGRLRFAAGRLVSAEAEGDRARVTWRPRGASRAEQLLVRRIVNGSGPELELARAGEALLDALLAGGRIRPDNVRLGIDVGPGCRAVRATGEPSDTLYAIGPITRGTFWESIAVSDIAAQAENVARQIAALRL